MTIRSISAKLTFYSGMPEQLKASAAIMGAGLKNVALVTDGRYSGASHGFIVGQ